MNDDNKDYLNDIWSMYFHDPYDNNWNYDSYISLGPISTIDDYWDFQTVLKDKVQCGMFFLMREHIFPCWDDDNNRDGGCLSIKVLKQDLKEFWEIMTMRLLGEHLLNDDVKECWDEINGISTSPKKHFCIVKLWLKSPKLGDKKYFKIPDNHHGDILYKSNNDSILTNNTPTIAS